MKLLRFNRRRLLRAIHAACVALFLMASYDAARAQTAMGDGHGDITISGSGGNTFFFSTSSTPPLAAGGTLTIASGANLSSSNSGNYGIEVHSPSTVTNSGSVYTFNNGGAPGVAIQFSTMSSGNVTINNAATGTFSGASGDAYARGIYVYDVQTGSFTLNNAGLVSASNYLNLALGVYAQVDEGPTVLTNSTTGTITASTVSGNYGDAVYLVSTSGPITVSNAGTILGSGFIAPGIAVQAVTGGNISISNSGNLTAEVDTAAVVPATCSLYGIIAQENGNGTLKVTNSSTGTISAMHTAGGATGVYFSDGGTGGVTVSNAGAINANGDQFARGIYEPSGGGAAVTLNSSGSITVASLNGEADGIDVLGSGSSLTINTAGPGTITATSTHSAAYGINVHSNGMAVVTNAETINATTTDSGYGVGINFSSSSGSASISNSGAITGTSGTEAGCGIQDVTSTGTLTISNSGSLLAVSSGNGGTSCAGIYALASNGSVMITNSGDIRGQSSTGAHGYGLNGGNSAHFTVVNTGTFSGTYAGVIVAGPAVITNSGTGIISGDVFSIDVRSGSTVNLKGSSSVIGLMRGGSNVSSTSVLNFDLAVPTAQLSADKTALNAAIATYDTDRSGANPGSTVESTVVTINGVDYVWENFAGVTDDLVSARRYGAYAGYLGLGSAIDNFSAGSTRAAAIVAALGNLSGGAVPSALGQLSPRALEALRHIAIDGAGFRSASVNDHLANLRDGLTGFDTSGFSVNAPGIDPTFSSIRSHLLAWAPAPESSGLLSDSPAPLFALADAKDMKNAVSPAEPVDRWSSFISGSVILANLDNTASNNGDADYTTGSVMAGVDYRLDRHVTVGALFDYSHTGADLDGNGSKATVDSYAPGVYGSYVDGPWYANGLVSYGFDSTTEDRKVTIPGLAGDNRGAADGGQVASNLTGGYEFQRGSFKFGPVAGVQYVHLRVDPFAENGPTSLAIGRQEDDSLRSQLGFEARYTTESATPVGGITFTPHLQASWQHECLDNSDGITASFNNTGGGSFVVQGHQPGRDSAFIDVGLDAGVAGNVTLFVDYQTEAGQNNFFAQSAQGGLRVGF